PLFPYTTLFRSNSIAHGLSFLGGCDAVFYEIFDNDIDDSVQRGSNRGNLMNDLCIGPVIVQHRPDGSDMSFYFRESVIDLGTLVIRHTLSRGGGFIKTRLMNAQAST